MVTASAEVRDILFNRNTSVAPLGLIAMDGTEELGKKIDQYLVNWAREGLRMPSVSGRRWKGTD